MSAHARPLNRHCALALAASVLCACLSALSAKVLEQRAQADILQGVDVSEYQRSIDWPSVASAGISFAYIRAGEGTSYVDPDYQRNWLGAKAAGITTGAYLFFHPSQDPIAQANLLVAELREVNFTHGDLQPAIDVETTDNLPPDAVVAGLQSAVISVQSSIGTLPVIYASPSWWDAHVGSSAFTSDPLWVANWGVGSPSLPAVGWGGNQWRIWQYSDAGSVPGISGAVDLDQAGAALLPIYGAAAAGENVLNDASFEPNLGGTWQPFDENHDLSLVIGSGSAADGQDFLELSTGVSGGSVFQDVSRLVGNGYDYTLSLRVRSASGRPVAGVLALWALGANSPEVNSTPFSAGARWTTVTATLNPQQQHAWLRAQVYLQTTDASLDMDGAELVPQLLRDGGFESGIGPWQPYGGTQETAMATETGAAVDGQSYLETSTSTPGGSVFQDVSSLVIPAHDYTLTIWVRSGSGQPLNSTLVLWGLGGNKTESVATPFVAGAGWTLVTTTLDPQQIHPWLRAQVYLPDTGMALDLDSAELLPQLLRNASFELATSPWQPFGGSQETAMTTHTGAAEDGQSYLETNTSTAGGSVFQDVSAAVTPGQDDTLAIWVRSHSGQPLTGTLALWAMGINGQESRSTIFTAGASWTLVTTTLDPLLSHSLLRAQVYLPASGAVLDLDGARLST